MTTITKLDNRQLWKQFNADPLNWYRNVTNDMKEAGVDRDFTPSVGMALEFVSPSDKSEPDAFARMMREAGIRTKSDASAGWWASTYEDFVKTAGGRALFTEFFGRKWREVTYANKQQRAVILAGDGTPGSWQRPYAESTSARWDERIAPAIPLSELVAMTTPINAQDYRALYLTYDAEELRMFRVGETAEIPIATVTSSERTISLKKYGRGIRASYEALRRARVDKLAYMIQLMAVQAEVDKMAAAMDVLVNGDGNANTTPTTYDLNGDLDSAATPGTMTLKGWLAFKMKFTNPYILTTALMNEDVGLQLALLNTGSANVPLVAANLGNLGMGLTPINQFADGVRYGWTAEAPSLKIVGFDRRFALERVTEIGAELVEMERFITNQTQVMVMTDVEGYAIMDANAVKILDVND